MIVIFDLVGTLFSLSKIKETFRDEGIQEYMPELWLAKLQQSSMAMTLSGEYVPFELLAQSTLRHVFAMNEIDIGRVNDILHVLEDIEPREDADKSLHILRSDGHRLTVLTNMGLDFTDRLLERWALRSPFERLFSADKAKAFKPSPTVYEMTARAMFSDPSSSCMVSAHGWDILGADSAGMHTIYLDSVEKQWPFPGNPPGLVVSSLSEVPAAVSKIYQKPAFKRAGEYTGEF